MPSAILIKLIVGTPLWRLAPINIDGNVDIQGHH